MRRVQEKWIKLTKSLKKMNGDELRQVNGGMNSEYSNMFEGCDSPAKPPELPATTLAESTYNNMFMNFTLKKCTNPECSKCGISFMTNADKCESCGEFLS